MQPLDLSRIWQVRPSDEIRARLRTDPGKFSEGPAAIREIRSPEGALLYLRVDFCGRSYKLLPVETFLALVGDYGYTERPSPQTSEMETMAAKDGQWWHIYRTVYGGAMFEYCGGAIEVNPWWARDLNFWVRDEDPDLIDPNALPAA